MNILYGLFLFTLAVIILEGFCEARGHKKQLHKFRVKPGCKNSANPICQQQNKLKKKHVKKKRIVATKKSKHSAVKHTALKKRANSVLNDVRQETIPQFETVGNVLSGIPSQHNRQTYYYKYKERPSLLDYYNGNVLGPIQAYKIQHLLNVINRKYILDHNERLHSVFDIERELIQNSKLPHIFVELALGRIRAKQNNLYRSEQNRHKRQADTGNADPRKQFGPIRRPIRFPPSGLLHHRNKTRSETRTKTRPRGRGLFAHFFRQRPHPSIPDSTSKSTKTEIEKETSATSFPRSEQKENIEKQNKVKNKENIPNTQQPVTSSTMKPKTVDPKESKDRQIKTEMNENNKTAVLKVTEIVTDNVAPEIINVTPDVEDIPAETEDEEGEDGIEGTDGDTRKNFGKEGQTGPVQGQLQFKNVAVTTKPRENHKFNETTITSDTKVSNKEEKESIEPDDSEEAEKKIKQGFTDSTGSHSVNRGKSQENSKATDGNKQVTTTVSSSTSNAKPITESTSAVSEEGTITTEKPRTTSEKTTMKLPSTTSPSTTSATTTSVTMSKSTKATTTTSTDQSKSNSTSSKVVSIEPETYMVTKVYNISKDGFEVSTSIYPVKNMNSSSIPTSNGTDEILTSVDSDSFANVTVTTNGTSEHTIKVQNTTMPNDKLDKTDNVTGGVTILPDWIQFKNDNKTSRINYTFSLETNNQASCDPVTHKGCDVINYERCVSLRGHPLGCKCLPGYIRGIGQDKCKGAKFFKGTVRILNEYHPMLTNPASSYYRALEFQVKSTLLRAAKVTKLRSMLLDLNVLKFRPGSVIVDYELALDRSQAPAVGETERLIHAGLSVILQYLPNNTIGLVNSQLIISSKNSPLEAFFASAIVKDPNPCQSPSLNYCDKNADCILTVRSFTCRCKANYADVSPKPFDAPGENCKLDCNCKNGGTCSLQDGKLVCLCTNWYVGPMCGLNGYLAFIIVTSVFSGILFITLITCCICVIAARKSGKSLACKKMADGSPRLSASRPESILLTLPRATSRLGSSPQLSPPFSHKSHNPHYSTSSPPTRYRQRTKSTSDSAHLIPSTPPSHPSQEYLTRRRNAQSVMDLQTISPHHHDNHSHNNLYSHYKSAPNVNYSPPVPEHHYRPRTTSMNHHKPEAIRMTSLPHNGRLHTHIDSEESGHVSDQMSTISEPIRCADELMLDVNQYSQKMKNALFQDTSFSRSESGRGFHNPMYPKAKSKSSDHIFTSHETGLSRL